ncbi:MAG: 3-methyl-2-oxobutanoate hydroxymethyltransferase [Desulfobacteraceae bacterium]|nr:MAG: 3-methyl-2-oxobutanoate hydroxymethyltransferase [Desulfobacteraceae bacterium]
MASDKFTIQSFRTAKVARRPISMLTAYDYTTATLLDEAGVDSVLVGDSLGMVMLGYDNTLRVTMDEMIHHTKAVARGTRRALLIGDMPFLSFHISVEETVRNAGRFIQEGRAEAVKLEGGAAVIDKIRAIVKAQIPVLGHLGLTPQSVNVFGGFKVQGKDIDAARRLVDDALLLQDAGVFGLVLEAVPDTLARVITQKLQIPTIGIGAGPHCDGQVLVIQDMLGMFRKMKPKFVKTYAHLGDEMVAAVKKYIEEVGSGQFPQAEHCFQMEGGLLSKL